MDLKRLRIYRRTLLGEELRASYWRRLLQARRDLLRADSDPGDRQALTDTLTEVRGTKGRQVILTLHPDGGMPILPHLPDLWATVVDRGDDATRAELFGKLASAESVLSSYREALHRRLDRATAELVARYHEDPSQCLGGAAGGADRAPSLRCRGEHRPARQHSPPAFRARRHPVLQAGPPGRRTGGPTGVQAVVQREPVPAAAVGARRRCAPRRSRSTATPTCSRPG